MKTVATILNILVLTATAQNAPAPPQQGLVFEISAEKQTLKTGEHIWVTALLRNPSESQLYVQHVMSPCSGYEARIEFELVAVKGRLPPSGRGCGHGSGSLCSHGCPPGPSIPDRIRMSWVLLKPGEFFGARIDSFLNAPNVAGVYRIRARYVPKTLPDHEQYAVKEQNMVLMQSAVEAAPVEIRVIR